MKRERILNCLCGAVIAFLLSWGAVGSMVTGLRLPDGDLGRLALICGFSAVAFCLCYWFRRGEWLVLAIGAAASWYLWEHTALLDQTRGMLYRICTLYNGAYGWGVPQAFRIYSGESSVLWPMGVIGTLTALAVSHAVCRREGMGLAALVASLPLISCVVVTDTVPGETYLFLWLLGFLLLLLPQGLRRRNMVQGVELTALAAVPAVIALGLLFWAVPREGYDNQPKELQEKVVNWVQELPDLWAEASDGLASALDGAVQTTEVNLRSLGPRLEKKYPVMEVTSSTGGTLYLRGQDYNSYTGTGWTSSQRRMEEFPEEIPSRTAGKITIRTLRVRDVLYLPYYPAEQVTLVGGSLDNTEKVKEYSYTQRALPETWRLLVNSEAAVVDTEVHLTVTGAALSSSPYDDQRYLVLPNATAQWAQEKLKTILSGERTATHIADTIGAYVRNSAAYDLNTGKMSGEYTDFAQWFLEESDTGYCVHFATAAVVLLRAAGVEARYVEGYMTTAAAGETVTVTADEAHAWAEYYEPLLDTWIVLEATPAEAWEEESTISETTESTESPESSEAETPTLPEPRPQSPQETSGTNAGTSEQPEAKRDLSGLWKALGWVLGAAAAAAAVELQRRIRLELRRRNRCRGHPNARALARWRELGLLCALLKEAPPPAAEELAQKAKYSSHTLTREELAVLEGAISDARQSLRARPWYLRILYKYIFAAF